MVRLVILILVGILVLSYFGISIRHIAESPTGTDNFTYVWMSVKEGWQIILDWIQPAINSMRAVFTA